MRRERKKIQRGRERERNSERQREREKPPSPVTGQDSTLNKLKTPLFFPFFILSFFLSVSSALALWHTHTSHNKLPDTILNPVNSGTLRLGFVYNTIASDRLSLVF